MPSRGGSRGITLLACSSGACPLILSLRDLLLRDGATHSGLDSPMSIINTEQSHGGIFSVEDAAPHPRASKNQINQN